MNGSKSKKLRKIARLTPFVDKEGNVLSDYKDLPYSDYQHRDTTAVVKDPITNAMIRVVKCTSFLADCQKSRNKKIKKQLKTGN